MALRVTASFVNVLSASTTFATTHYDRTTAQALMRQDIMRQIKFTSLHLMTLASKVPALNNKKFTSTYVQILASYTPDFTWIDDMFVNEVFPFDISYQSVGATKFATDVIVVDSGNDQRTSRWDQPLMEYDIAYGVRTIEQLHALIAFFRAMRGRKFGFLYDDYIDNASTLAVRIEARSIPPTSFLDQQIGIGDEVQYQFQLIKVYPAGLGTSLMGGTIFTRIISKPKPGTVKVGLGALSTTFFTVDNDKGIIIFVPDVHLTAQDLGTLNATFNGGGEMIVSGVAGTFSNPALKVGRRITMSGWVSPLNNFGITVRSQIVDITSDKSTITISVPNGVGQSEAGAQLVDIMTHPAPDAGVVITAGYQFYVPVRFDTDRLPITLDDYGVGGANDVKLVELRPSEALPNENGSLT